MQDISRIYKYLFGPAMKPTFRGVVNRVDTADIRLNIKYWCALYYIESTDGKGIVPYTDQFDNCVPDGINAVRRPGSKESMLDIIPGSLDQKFRSMCLMEPVKKV